MYKHRGNANASPLLYSTLSSNSLPLRIPFHHVRCTCDRDDCWFQPSRAVSIWTFALLALIATAFVLLCGGRFRTFYIAIAVMLPFLFLLQWFLRVRSWIPDFPSKPVAEYFLYFVAAPILLVWVVATLLNRKERHA